MKIKMIAATLGKRGEVNMGNIYKEIIVFIEQSKPDEAQKFLLTIGGVLGFWFSWAVGGVDSMIIWIAVLACLDYLTGVIAAFKGCVWCSAVGFKGIAKKVLMFVIIAVCHGVDQTTGMDTFRNMAIFAYAVNEVGSIIENIDACGWGKYIPQFLRNGLEKLKDKHKV